MSLLSGSYNGVYVRICIHMKLSSLGRISWFVKCFGSWGHMNLPTAAGIETRRARAIRESTPQRGSHGRRHLAPATYLHHYSRIQKVGL